MFFQEIGFDKDTISTFERGNKHLKFLVFFFAGLVRSRDGSHLSPNTQPYISLPSPNIQSAKVSEPFLSITETAIYFFGQ